MVCWGACAAQTPQMPPPTSAAPPPASASDESVTKAEEGAKAWLVLVDSGQYGQAWTKASPVFQRNIREADWDKGAADKLGSAGGVKSRVLRDATPKDAIPGAPPGHYVSIMYYTEFKSVEPANEYVTMSQEKDGSWKVMGYGLQAASATQTKP